MQTCQVSNWQQHPPAILAVLMQTDVTDIDEDYIHPNVFNLQQLDLVA